MSEQRVYIYETTKGDTVVVRHDAEFPTLLELPFENASPESLLPEDLAAGARDCGYEVFHYRFKKDAGIGPNGGFVRVLEDGTERDESPSAGDIALRSAHMADKRLPSVPS